MSTVAIASVPTARLAGFASTAAISTPLDSARAGGLMKNGISTGASIFAVTNGWGDSTRQK
jgi:hypothetical protein